MKSVRRTTAFAITAALVCSATAQTEDKSAVDPAKWAPGNALGFLGISDVKTLGEEMKQTAFYKLTQDPSAKEAGGQFSMFTKLFDEFKKRVAQAIDIEPDKLENPFAGPLAVYAAAPPGAGPEDVNVVLVAGVGDRELMRGYYQRATGKLREVADNHEAVSFGSYTLDHFTTADRADDEADEDEDPNDLDLDTAMLDEDDFMGAMDEVFGEIFSADALPEELALCLTEDRLIVAPTLEHVKDVLRRERAGSSLAETELYGRLRREFKPLGSMRMLVDLRSLFEIIAKDDGDEARESLEIVGAKGIRGLIAHARYDGKEYESKGEMLLLLEGQRTGLAKIFSMKNRPIAPSASVSAGSLIFASMNINPTDIVDEVERMVRRSDPETADEMHKSMESIELPDGGVLNLRKDVFEHLRGPLAFALAFQRPYDAQSTRLSATLGHRDKAAMNRLLDTLGLMSGGMMIQRELRGTMVYDIPFGGISIAATDDAIVAGTTNTVDVMLQTAAPEQSLAASATFKRAAALAPAEAWGVVYVDSRRLYEAVIELAKNKEALMAAQFSNPISMLALQMVETYAGDADAQQLDAIKNLAKYQAATLMTAETTPDGIKFTQIQLKPDGE